MTELEDEEDGGICDGIIMKTRISPNNRFFMGISILLFLAFHRDDTSSMEAGKRKDADVSWREFHILLSQLFK